MGSCSVKIRKSENQILHDLKELNNITRNMPFERRVGFNIKFTYICKNNKIFTHLVNIC